MKNKYGNMPKNISRKTKNSIMTCIRSLNYVYNDSLIFSLSDLNNYINHNAYKRTNVIDDLFKNKTHNKYINDCVSLHRYMYKYFIEYNKTMSIDFLKGIRNVIPDLVRCLRPKNVEAIYMTATSNTNQGKIDINRFRQAIKKYCRDKNISYKSPFSISKYRQNIACHGIDKLESKVNNLQSTLFSEIKGAFNLSDSITEKVISYIKFIFSHIFQHSTYDPGMDLNVRIPTRLKKLSSLLKDNVSDSSKNYKFIIQLENIDNSKNFSTLKDLLVQQFAILGEFYHTYNHYLDMAALSNNANDEYINPANLIPGRQKERYRFYSNYTIHRPHDSIWPWVNEVQVHLAGKALVTILIEAINFFNKGDIGDIFFGTKLQSPISDFTRITCFTQIMNTLHPFYDGHGRFFVVSLQNILLLMHGYPFTMHYEMARVTGLGGLIPSNNSEYSQEIAYGCLIRREFDNIKDRNKKISFLKIIVFIWSCSEPGKPLYSPDLFQDIISDPTKFCLKYFGTANINYVTTVSLSDEGSKFSNALKTWRTIKSDYLHTEQDIIKSLEDVKICNLGSWHNHLRKTKIT